MFRYGGFALKISKVLACILVVVAACVVAACHAAPLSDDADAGSDLPELKIGVSTLNPFFYIDENGDYKGIDAEIATEACRRAGYRPVFVEVSWSDRDEYLQNGSVDCLWNAFIKDGREDAYRWTDAYMQTNLRVIVTAQSPDQDVWDASGRGGIAVRAGSKIEEILLNSSGTSVVQVYSCGTFEMAETAFVKGYTNALGGHEVVLQRVIDSYPGQFRFIDGAITTADLAVAFSKDDDTRHWQDINDALDEMRADGTIAGILAVYGADIPPGEAEEVSADA